MTEKNTNKHNNKKSNTTVMASIYVTTLRKMKNKNDSCVSQDKEKDVEEEELCQRGERKSGEKKEEQNGGQNEWLRGDEGYKGGETRETRMGEEGGEER